MAVVIIFLVILQTVINLIMLSIEGQDNEGKEKCDLRDENIKANTETASGPNLCHDIKNLS